MFSDFLLFEDSLDKNKIRFVNNRIIKIFSCYSFHCVSDEIDFVNNRIIYENMKESAVVLISQYDENDNSDNKYFILSFKKTLICIKQSSINLVHKLLIYNPNLTICFLKDTKKIFDQILIIPYNEYVTDSNFQDEIDNFNKEIVIFSNNIVPDNEIFVLFISCITGYLICNAYMKTYEDRFKLFTKKNRIEIKAKEYDQNEFIYLRQIGSSGLATCNLYYHIENEELCVIKINFYSDTNLGEREISNYENISHPLIPKFYGTVQLNHQKSVVIEFINGKTLVEKSKLNEQQRCIIILELLTIFYYLHDKNYIYRDLKPSNIIIDKKQNAILIDFDRMITISNESEDKSIQYYSLAANQNHPKAQYNIGMIFFFGYLWRSKN